MKNKQKDTAMAKSRTKNEKAKHVLSVLLDELTKSIWRDSVMCWALSGGNDESVDGSLLLTLDVYESYTISQRHLTELVEKFEVTSYEISFHTVHGVLEIRIDISSD